MAQLKKGEKVFSIPHRTIVDVVSDEMCGVCSILLPSGKTVGVNPERYLVRIDDTIRQNQILITDEANQRLDDAIKQIRQNLDDQMALLGSILHPELRDILVKIKEVEYRQKLVEYQKSAAVNLGGLDKKPIGDLHVSLPYLAKCKGMTNGKHVSADPTSGMTDSEVTFSVPDGATDVRCTYRLQKKMVTKEAEKTHTREMLSGIPPELHVETFKIPVGARNVHCFYDIPEPEEKTDLTAKDEEIKNLHLSIRSVVDDAQASGEAYEKKVLDFFAVRLGTTITLGLLKELPKFELHSFGWLKSQAEKPTFLRKIMD